MTLAPPKRLYGIIGYPLSQSLSPALHTWAFAELGHAGAYFAWEKTPDELPEFFRAVRTLPVAGLSVTIPHKEAVIPHLDGLTDRARSVGAVNTVFWRDGKLWGDNTDVQGFLAPLRELQALPERALVLGAGGACRAVLAGLRELGLSNVAVAARSPEKAAPLERDFDCAIIAWEERALFLQEGSSVLVINVTPLGMKGKAEGQSPLPEESFAALTGQRSSSIAYDAVYNPRHTRFLADAAGHGIATLDGLAFFTAQAAEQLRLWTGLEPPLDGLRRTAQSLLESNF